MEVRMKRFMGIGVVLLLCGSLSVFASGQTEPDGGSGQAEPVEIEFMNWMESSELEGWAEALTAFESTYPSIDLVVNSVPGSAGYEDKLKIRVLTDDAPELFQAATSAYFKSLASEGLVFALDEQIENDEEFDIDQYPERLLTAFSVEDQIFGLPKDISVPGLIFNLDLFDAAGMEYPDESWTWQQLRTAAEELSRDDNGDGETDVFGFAAFKLNFVLVDPAFYTVTDGPGATNYHRGDRVTLNDPRNVEALEFFRGMFFDDKSAPSAASQLNPVDLFNTGRIAMLYGATHMFPALYSGDTDFGVTMLPSGEGGVRAATLMTSGFAVSENAGNVDAAWEAIKFMSYGEGNRLLSVSSGSVPATTQYLDAYLTDEMIDIGFESLLKMTDHVVAWNYGVNGSEFRRGYGSFLDAVFTQPSASVKDLADEATAELRTLFEPF
jgi:multiple sugar transport system substrate-binding protein